MRWQRTSILIILLVSAASGCLEAAPDDATHPPEPAVQDDNNATATSWPPFPAGTGAAYTYVGGNRSDTISIAADVGHQEMLPTGQWVETNSLTTNASLRLASGFILQDLGRTYSFNVANGEYVADLVDGPRNGSDTSSSYRLHHHGMREARSTSLHDPIVAAMATAWLPPGTYQWTDAHLEVQEIADAKRVEMTAPSMCWTLTASAFTDDGWPTHVLMDERWACSDSYVWTLDYLDPSKFTGPDSGETLDPRDLKLDLPADAWASKARPDGALLWYPKALERRADLMLILDSMLVESTSSLTGAMVLMSAEWSADWQATTSDYDTYGVGGVWDGSWAVALMPIEGSPGLAHGIWQRWMSRQDPQPVAVPIGEVDSYTTVVLAERPILGDPLVDPLTLESQLVDIFQGQPDWFSWSWQWLGMADSQEIGYYFGFGCWPNDTGRATIIFLDAADDAISRYFWNEPYTGIEACELGFEESG